MAHDGARHHGTKGLEGVGHPLRFARTARGEEDKGRVGQLRLRQGHPRPGLRQQCFEARAAAVIGTIGDDAQWQLASQLAGGEVWVAFGMG